MGVVKLCGRQRRTYVYT